MYAKDGGGHRRPALALEHRGIDLPANCGQPSRDGLQGGGHVGLRRHHDPVVDVYVETAHEVVGEPVCQGVCGRRHAGASRGGAKRESGVCDEASVGQAVGRCLAMVQRDAALSEGLVVVHVRDLDDRAGGRGTQG